MFAKGWRAKEAAAKKRSAQRIVSAEIRAQRAAILAGEPLPVAEPAPVEPADPAAPAEPAAPAAKAKKTKE